MAGGGESAAPYAGLGGAGTCIGVAVRLGEVAVVAIDAGVADRDHLAGPVQVRVEQGPALRDLALRQPRDHLIVRADALPLLQRADVGMRGDGHGEGEQAAGFDVGLARGVDPDVQHGALQLRVPRVLYRPGQPGGVRLVALAALLVLLHQGLPQFGPFADVLSRVGGGGFVRLRGQVVRVRDGIGQLGGDARGHELFQDPVHGLVGQGLPLPVGVCRRVGVGDRHPRAEDGVDRDAAPLGVRPFLQARDAARDVLQRLDEGLHHELVAGDGQRRAGKHLPVRAQVIVLVVQDAEGRRVVGAVDRRRRDRRLHGLLAPEAARVVAGGRVDALVAEEVGVLLGRLVELGRERLLPLERVRLLPALAGDVFVETARGREATRDKVDGGATAGEPAARASGLLVRWMQSTIEGRRPRPSTAEMKAPVPSPTADDMPAANCKPRTQGKRGRSR